MDSQKVERRDSKKSNKGGGNGNKNQGRGGGGSSSSNGGSGGGSSGNGKSSGEKQRSHSQKSGKPYREIYKPPSLRSSKNRNSNSSSEGNSKSEDVTQSNPKKSNINQSSKNGNNQNKNNSMMSQQYNESSSDPQNGYSLFGNGTSNVNGSNSSSHSSVPSSPLLPSRMQNSLNFDLTKRFNVDAKEFQFLPMQHQQQQQQQQQLSKFLSQFDPSLLYGVNSPILNSPYPLKQSKSSGNMNFLQQQHQQQQQVVQAQAAALQQLQNAIGLGFGNLAGAATAAAAVNANNGINQFNRLSQSKSSGNVPGGGKPRVRFDDEDDFEDDDLGLLASLKLNGDLSGIPTVSNNFSRFQFPQPKPSSFVSSQKPALHKSRTGFYLNLQGSQQLGSPTKSPYGFANAATSGGFQSPTVAYGNKIGGNNQQNSPFLSGGMTNVVKRSRSFGPGNHHVPKVSAMSLLSASTPPSTGHSIYADFCLKSWPRTVQVLVTDAVVGVERIPTRSWIEMVNGIFEAMLCNYRPSKTEKAESTGNACSAPGRNVNEGEDDEDDDDDDDETDLTSAAVHIFLYFIQKEKDKKDRIVMESLLNACFAYFQRLSSTDKRMTTMATNFLRFLSTLYSQVKLRHKQSQQQLGMDEMSFSLLALLADFIATLIRSPPSDEMMGYLFTVLTSHGRDIEFYHPLKMKRLLAGVRDVLLGIGPYYQQQGNKKGPSGLSPMVQKTLMQLIELHASNWQLCASQVSYYHCKSTNPTNTTNNTSSSSGNNQAHIQKTNCNNNNSLSACSTTSSTSSPGSPSMSTSSAVSNVSNDTVDNNDGCEVAPAASPTVTSESNCAVGEKEEGKASPTPTTSTSEAAETPATAVTPLE